MDIQPGDLALERLKHWEQVRANAVCMTQPMGNGELRDYTWAQAVDEARRMASWLRAQNYPERSNIAIISKNCAHWLMGDWAIWMAGHISVPLYPTLTAESVRKILEHSEAQAAFVGKLDDWDAMKAGVPDSVQCISFPLSPPTDFPTWEDIIRDNEPLQALPERKVEDLATIIYTSGTTGMPKGVMHSFGGMAWAIASGNKRFNMGPEDRVLSYLPLSHIAERIAVELGMLRVGMRTYFAESLDTFAQDLQRARPTFFFSVPRLWIKFKQAVNAKMPDEKLDRMLKIPVVGGMIRRKILKQLGLDQVKFAGGGAAPMPPSVLEWYEKLGLEIIEVYGMTENLAISHSNLPGKTRPGFVGYPYEGVEARLGEDGEVQTRSPAVMQGYFKEPEKTREVMTEDGFLRTGDRGELDDEGRLRITGRVKDIFKTSKGKYVAPAPIEDKLVTHNAVEACCVAGADRSQPFGILMLSEDALTRCKNREAREALMQDLAEYREKVNAQLDQHEQLEFLVVVEDQWTTENDFVTPTMKVKRNVVEDHYLKHAEDWAAKRQPVVWAGTTG
ncbi:AMP-binding protein [Algiphilus aromaticivorans]|uniref:AMP-binding protein n=1 Tax=Algiphilus aromaticivorans TaxID=382454 RepID=UPI0005C1FA2B|nr:AMP-binding protein [Algiphilus aromaticivorans]